MKTIIFSIFIALTGVTDTVSDELYFYQQTGLKVKTYQTNLSEPQQLADFDNIFFKLVSLKYTNRTDRKYLFLLPYLTDGVSIAQYSGGQALIGKNIGVVFNITATGFDNRNTNVRRHEMAHLLGAMHNTDACNLMNAQPVCSDLNNTSKKQILRKQYVQKNLKKFWYVKLTKQLRS
jgi:hypothetical protein